MALTYSYNAPTNSYYVVNDSCTAGAVVIPSTYNDGVNGVRPVGGIYDSAFAGCTSITSIVIPNSVTYLGDGAFDGCTNLSSVTIGTGVTGFSYLLFQDCTSLINLTVPSNILIISSESFYGCSNLANINIDSNNPNYTSVNGVVFNKNITTLVLYPIGKTGSYSIPNTVTSIGFESFLGCANLTNITIPNSITSIGYYAFSNCTSLTSITIPNSVTSIGEGAFAVCTSLTSVIIPNSVTSIGDTAFSNCTSLTSITIPNSVTSIGNTLFYSCGLTSITIPNSVTSIGNSVFGFCTALTSIKISNSVTSIGSYAFYHCTNLNNVTISKNVNTIGAQAFEYCTSLTRINFLGNPPTLGTNIFINGNVNLKVYRYSTKSGWGSTFGDRPVLLIDSGTKGLRSFGFGASSSGQTSVKKTNVGSGRLTLSKFDPKNISNIALWTTQGGWDGQNNYSIVYLEFDTYYSGNDIDTIYYPDDSTYTSYTGSQFGFTITYDETVGLWYLIDPNIEADIAYSENLLAGSWIVYGVDLNYFELINYDYDSFTSTSDTFQFIWSDISGKNNNLLTRPFPRNGGITISSVIFSNLETKRLNTPFKTSNVINLLNPFTIYMVLLDPYIYFATRNILGIQGRDENTTYSNLYLESTSSSSNHIFSLKYYNTYLNLTQTAFSVNVNKSIFASSTYAPSILKLSSNYITSSISPSRTMSLTYYNLYKDVNPTIGSVSGAGYIAINNSALPSNCKLYIGSDSYGKTVNWSMDLAEVIIYDKFLNSIEDGTINRYLQRKYYGKLLS